MHRFVSYLTSKDCMSEGLANICKQNRVRTVFKHSNTLRQQLMHVKSRHKNGDKGIIYQTPCLDCDRTYIGETGRPFSVRMKEHQRAVMTGDMKNANAVHSGRDNVRILDREQNWYRRKIEESLYIRKHKNFNLDSGFSLSHVWDPLVVPSTDSNI